MSNRDQSMHRIATTSAQAGSALRQLTFLVASIMGVSGEDEEMALAQLHEEEARYHQKEAQWIKRNYEKVPTSAGVVSSIKSPRSQKKASPRVVPFQREG